MTRMMDFDQTRHHRYHTLSSNKVVRKPTRSFVAHPLMPLDESLELTEKCASLEQKLEEQLQKQQALLRDISHME